MINIEQILNEIRDYFLKNNKDILLQDDSFFIKESIKKYLNERIDKYQIKSDSINSLSEKLYLDIAKYSFLTELLDDKEIEEININSYNNILITYSNGITKKSKETFYSQEHSLDIIRKLLRNSNMIIDQSKPLARGFLKKNIRITAFIPPIVDKEVGISCSIRIINPKKLSKEDVIKNKTLNKEMLDLLIGCLKNNISICCSGATSSGKTTIMSLILNDLKDEKRIITIENEVREFNLNIENNNKYSNVVHLVTKDSEVEERKITQEKLLEYALTSNPDIICISECKSHEAFYAQEAARTGHSVITTIHANSCDDSYKRLLTLCKEKSSIRDEVLKELIAIAFPITFFMKRFKDGKRKIIEIKEYVKDEKNDELRTLFLYKNKGFVKVNEVSPRLKKMLEAS